LIHAHYNGVLHAPAGVIGRLRGGEPVDPGEYYFRVVPFPRNFLAEIRLAEQDRGGRRGPPRASRRELYRS